MHADNDLEEFALLDIAEMAEGMRLGEDLGADALRELNVVIQIDRSRLFDDFPLLNLFDFTDTKRIRVGSGALEVIDELGEINSDLRTSLTDFVTWSLERYPSRRTALLFWDHGASYAGFGGDYDNQDAAAPKLTLQDLRLGVESALEERALPNFDLIGFDACLMASVDTAYAMSFVADFLVASEDLEWGYGWAYADIIRTLLTNPEISPRELGIAIIDSFFSSLPSSEKTATLSLIDLQGMGHFTDQVAELVSQLTPQLDTGDFVGEVATALFRSQAFARPEDAPFSRDMGDFYSA